jgi:hypothetical protein
MIVKDDDVKRLYQEGVHARTPEDRRDCPTPEDLVRIATPGADIPNRLELLEHVGGCSMCAAEVKYILDLHSESEVLSGRLAAVEQNRPFGIRRILPPRRSPQFLRFAFGILGIAMTIASLYVLVHRRNPPIDLRSTQLSIELFSPIGGYRSSAPLFFEWQDIPEADHYRLEVYSIDLLPLWSSPKLTANRLLLPDGVARRLLKDKTHFWMVTAFSKNEKIAESNFVPFVLLSR